MILKFGPIHSSIMKTPKFQIKLKISLGSMHKIIENCILVQPEVDFPSLQIIIFMRFYRKYTQIKASAKLIQKAANHFHIMSHQSSSLLIISTVEKSENP